MWRAVLTVGIVVGLILSVGGDTALAAQPSNQACLGEDVSGYAQGDVFGSGAAFGQFVGWLASTTPGVGEDIQLHLAGLVPDGDIPNSCND